MRRDFCASFYFRGTPVVCRGSIAGLSRTRRCLLLLPEDTGLFS